jgi:RNA polymerase sigma factor (TIGR02999 family)
MRQVLVDSARRRRAIKREGQVVTIDDDLPVDAGPEDHILAVDTALTRFAAVNERAAQVVEAHFFGGLDWVETGHLLGISEATVHRDWRVARAWLAVELGAVT